MVGGLVGFALVRYVNTLARFGFVGYKKNTASFATGAKYKSLVY